MDEKELNQEAETKVEVQETKETKEVQEETVKAQEETKTEEAQDETKVKKLKSSKGPRNSRKRKIETVDPVENEWKEQVVQISRVTKVVKGGKKLSFRAIVIVGNKKGQVGMGVAKAAEVIIAIQKAIADGRKNLVTVPIFKTSVPHKAFGTSGAGSVVLKPASVGTGVIAGGAVRAVLELAGYENILSKSLGSKSPLNAANATINALKSLKTFKEIAAAREISLKQMLS